MCPPWRGLQRDITAGAAYCWHRQHPGHRLGGCRIKSYPKRQRQDLRRHVRGHGHRRGCLPTALQNLANHCPRSQRPHPSLEGSTAVAVSNITFANTRGTGRPRSWGSSTTGRWCRARRSCSASRALSLQAQPQRSHNTVSTPSQHSHSTRSPHTDTAQKQHARPPADRHRKHTGPAARMFVRAAATAACAWKW